MPGEHNLRLHIEYEVLYVSDLRTIVRTFERAYNILQKAEEPTGRMRRTDRLTVQTVRTGNSITLILLGKIALTQLGVLIAARELLWRSEKTKWEAKSARVDYEEKVRKVEEARIAEVEARLDREGAPEAKAARLIERLGKIVVKSKEIRSIEVEIDGKDSDPNNPGPVVGPARPTKQLGPLTIRTGRKFR